MSRQSRSPSRLASSGVVTYVGVRDGLFAELSRYERDPELGRLQVVDLVGSGATENGSLVSAIAPDPPTLVLSTRRVNLRDHLGDTERLVLAVNPSAVILRCAPLDLSIPLLWAWAAPTGKLMSSFRPGGVPWIFTGDLAQIVARLEPQEILRHSGRAFDVTGPARVSMQTLADLMCRELGVAVDLECLSPEDFVAVMAGNGFPENVATWISHYQASTSDEALEDLTPVLATLLGRTPTPAQLVPTFVPKENQ